MTPTINAIGTLMMVISVATIALAVALPRLVGRRDDRAVLLGGEV